MTAAVSTVNSVLGESSRASPMAAGMRLGEDLYLYRRIVVRTAHADATAAVVGSSRSKAAADECVGKLPTYQPRTSPRTSPTRYMPR